MKNDIEQILEQCIIKHAFINNYPKPGVIFLAIDSLFKDAKARSLISKAVIASINPESFDAVAGIASRGYLFSGIIANQFKDKGENLVQKVKCKGDAHYLQLDTTTEYSSDALQVLKSSIQKGKKYVLTDDLIATGGSLMAAIELIRKGGGEVNTAFVMTELTDFNAREQLKLQGVELISLLKLSQQDLQKLLHIQKCHDENSTTPITYQLSNHASGDQALIESNKGSTLQTTELVDQHFTINRFVELSGHKSMSKLAKKGIFFTPTKNQINTRPINLYNHGCPVTKWNIDPDKVTRNSFQVFVTGDAFSVISPKIELTGANIVIHVGLEHANYSQDVLLQEALQLTRCAYEHGARSITIALPDQFHPITHCSDFNRLLMNLFKASGANKLYYYDKNYTGKLDEANLSKTLPLIISNQSDPSLYKIDRKAIQEYLKTPATSLDEQVMHVTREHKFKGTLAKFAPNNTEIIEAFCGTESLSELNIPEITRQAHVVLCCSANKSMAQKIVNNMRMQGELVELYAIEGQGENATIPKDAKICGALVTIVQSTRPNPDCIEETREYQKNGASAYLFEAAIIAKQAQLRGAQTINLINPYQFSARSDKAENNAKGKTGAYVQQNGMLLETAGVNHVITAECHDNHTMSGSYTGKKIKGSAISALSHISVKLAKEWLHDSNNSLQGQLRLVTPDAGAAKRTKELTELLQAVLGDSLCRTRVLGEKQRDSHKDDSALISSMNSGAVGINHHDKYLITDDETATGNTLCQAVESLVNNGAKNIAVVIVHNNISLDWLQRQMCLARFFYQGVSDLHFSDSHEMGSLANSYDDLIATYVARSHLSKNQVEEQVFNWFKDTVCKNFSDKSEEHIMQEFERYKSMFAELKSKIRVHSLAEEFANKVLIKPYVEQLDTFEQIPKLGFFKPAEQQVVSRQSMQVLGFNS
ncbi:MAG: phosphoribosyltransferase family protein [Legionella sp.]|jgi:adenine phosphoribosyltransferase